MRIRKASQDASGGEPTMGAKGKQKKKAKLRYAEYYDQQNISDTLYADSQNGKLFQSLMPLITAEENIKMAFRTIRQTQSTQISTMGMAYHHCFGFPFCQSPAASVRRAYICFLSIVHDPC